MIDVAIPSVQILHTASLTTIAEDGSRGTTKMMALGDVLAMELEIKQTRRWDRLHHGHHSQSTYSSRIKASANEQKDANKKKETNNVHGKAKERDRKGKKKRSIDISSKNIGTANLEIPTTTATTAAAAGIATSSTTENHDEPIEFVYEIRADPSKWLVSGQRRTRFTMTTAHEDDVHRFQVLLIPLVTGELLFPGIDIKVFEKPRYFDIDADADADANLGGLDSDDHGKGDTRLDGDGSQSKDDGGRGRRSVGSSSGDKTGNGEKSENTSITCETDYLSQSESIVVVPNIRSCTVGIGFTGRHDDVDAKKKDGDKGGDGRVSDDYERGNTEEEEKEESRQVETRLLDVEYRTDGFA